jgi:hypothetical protein
MAKLSVDKLIPKRGLIDLTGFSRNSFDSFFNGYKLAHVLDDIILVRYVDEGNTQNEIIRGGIVVPVNADSHAWRIGEVILAGKSCQLVERGDHICFPNNLGINIANIEIDGYGLLKSGHFINEQRIFGVVKPLEQTNNNVSNKRKSKSSSTK